MARQRSWARLSLAFLVLAAGCAPRGDHRPAAAGPPPPHAAPCLANLPNPAAAPSTAGMVHLPGGTFEMGARPLRREEGPPRSTRVGGFWIDRTDVTNAQFARFVAATGYVTLAERPLDPKAYPRLHGDQLKPSAIVFVGSRRPAGSDPSQWWAVVLGADWPHRHGREPHWFSHGLEAASEAAPRLNAQTRHCIMRRRLTYGVDPPDRPARGHLSPCQTALRAAYWQ